MGIDYLTLSAAKGYTDESLLGGGSLVGKNVTISSITPIDGGNRVAFSYTLDNGTVKTSSLDVMNGKSAYDIAVENGFTGTEQEWISKTFVDNVVTADSDHAVSSKAVKAYVDASMKTEVKDEVSEQIKTEIGDTVQTTIEEKMAENMGTASNDDIDSLFA